MDDLLERAKREAGIPVGTTEKLLLELVDEIERLRAENSALEIANERLLKISNECNEEVFHLRTEVASISAIRDDALVARMVAEDEASKLRAKVEALRALLMEASRECHEDLGLAARIDAALAKEKP